MQWSRRSISWTSFSSPWVRARDSNRNVDLAVGRPIVPAHTGRGYRAESRTFDRRVPHSLAVRFEICIRKSHMDGLRIESPLGADQGAADSQTPSTPRGT